MSSPALDFAAYVRATARGMPRADARLYIVGVAAYPLGFLVHGLWTAIF